MQYHAISIKNHGGIVDLVGYKETARNPELVGHPRVTLYPLAEPPAVLKWETLPFFVAGPSKVIWQALSIFKTLAYTTPPARWIIIQVCHEYDFT
jgi:beta-1,4-mannosyltransferase